MNATLSRSLEHARGRATSLRMRDLLFSLTVVALSLGPVASPVAFQGRANQRCVPMTGDAAFQSTTRSRNYCPGARGDLR